MCVCVPNSLYIFAVELGTVFISHYMSGIFSSNVTLLLPNHHKCLVLLYLYISSFLQFPTLPLIFATYIFGSLRLNAAVIAFVNALISARNFAVCFWCSAPHWARAS